MTAWLDRRIPPASQYRLNRHNLFIFPVKHQWVYQCLTVWRFFRPGSTMKQSGALALAYLLFSPFVIPDALPPLQLQYLTVEALMAPTGYAGAPLRFLAAGKRNAPRCDLQLSAIDGLGEHLPTLENRATGVTFIANTPWLVATGRLRKPANGRLVCWNADTGRSQQTGLAYPVAHCYGTAVAWKYAAGGSHRASSAWASQTVGMDEMQGVRPYRSGESTADRVETSRTRAWLVSKEFMIPIRNCVWLELQTPGLDLKNGLSKLCYQLQTLEQQRHITGLLLGSQSIARPGEVRCIKPLSTAWHCMKTTEHLS